MRIKKVAIFLLIGMLCFNQNIPVFAEVSPNVAKGVAIETPITPQWVNTNDVRLDLYFVNGKAECVGIINGISGTSNISATFKLERKGLLGWSLENSWSTSSKGASLSFYETDAVAKGYTYRLSVTARVTTNGVTETVNTFAEGKY
ncbi:hypothetical protein [Sedimentibacter sp.]|uniref:hypothetical protein n=1 Tax=Sedimentibacter sp. TaxID=1960295 RepID=UPI00289DD262|nr:hypothetical protein [Sedimentibacter sp.]